MKRPLLNKDLSKEAEFLVEYNVGDKVAAKAVPFTINPNSITNVSSVSFILIEHACALSCFRVLT